MGLKVLLVDDVNLFLELEKEYLRRLPMSVFVARDGREALTICQRENPDLIFMDLNMPVMNGADCCRVIKQDQRYRSTPVVLITSEGKEEDRLLCFDAGCDEFLTKPLDRDRFLSVTHRLLPQIDHDSAMVGCHSRAKFRAFGVTFSGFVVEINKKCLYLSTHYDLEQGTLLDLIFALPDPAAPVIQAKGRVTWLNTRENRTRTTLPEGVGVEFVSLSDAAGRDISRFVEEQTKGWEGKVARRTGDGSEDAPEMIPCRGAVNG